MGTMGLENQKPDEALIEELIQEEEKLMLESKHLWLEEG
jgi:hypothetical protein